MAGGDVMWVRYMTRINVLREQDLEESLAPYSL